jgi:hypothetical protein
LSIVAASPDGHDQIHWLPVQCFGSAAVSLSRERAGDLVEYEQYTARIRKILADCSFSLNFGEL